MSVSQDFPQEAAAPPRDLSFLVGAGSVYSTF